MNLRQPVFMAFALLLSAALLTACGRKGDPERPGATSISGQNARAANKAPEVEDRPFVLDPLL